jgi:hypothetical protein
VKRFKEYYRYVYEDNIIKKQTLFENGEEERLREYNRG